MEIFLMEIPVIQTILKTNEEGKKVEVQRTVPELIAPQHIIRVSPSETGTVIWLAHGVPYLESPTRYPDFIELLRTIRNGESNEDATD